MIAKKLILVAVVLVTLTACSSTNNAGDFYRVNQLAQTRTANVRLSSGVEFKAEVLRVMPDSAYYIQPRTAQPSSFPTSTLESVTFVNRKKGAYRGFRNVLIGTGASILGGVAMRNTCDTNSGSFFPDCTAFYMVFFPVVLAPFTIPASIIVGALHGVRDTYKTSLPDPLPPEGQ